MKFSVIIPIYKVEQYLEECVQSVLAQTYDDFEVILVDDGSPDNCPAMCDNYAANDNRIKVIHKQNGGQGDARNVGLALACGDFVIFMDSDDYWDDTTILKKVAALLESDNKVDVVLSQYKILREKIYSPKNFDAERVNGSTLDKALAFLIASKLYNVGVWDKFIRRSILIENKIKFEKGLLCEDYDWSFQLYAHVRKLKMLPEAFYVYRKRKGSSSTSVSDKHVESFLWMIEKWVRELPQIYEDEKLREVQYNQLGFMYWNLLTLVALSSDPQKYLTRMKPYTYLLRYDIHPMVRVGRICVSLLGLNLTYFLKSVIVKWRRKRVKYN